MTQPAGAARLPKGRSPSYPAIDLEAAINRARQLYERARQHPTPVESVAHGWGYKSLNGPAAVTLAALKKFGLMDEEGTGAARRAKITELGRIVLSHPDPEQRKAAIQAAALRPLIHRELWEQYHADLPPDENLEWELTHRPTPFTETGVREFIPEYKATIAYAELTTEPATVETQEEDGGDAPEDEDEDPPPPPPNKNKRRRMSTATEVREYAIPLASGPEFTVSLDDKITEEDWTQILAFLEVLKPGLMRRDEE